MVRICKLSVSQSMLYAVTVSNQIVSRKHATRRFKVKEKEEGRWFQLFRQLAFS
jgi:hypothetical protein